METNCTVVGLYSMLYGVALMAEGRKFHSLGTLLRTLPLSCSQCRTGQLVAQEAALTHPGELARRMGTLCQGRHGPV